MSRAAAFLSSGRPLDYAARLGRLRWQRAAGAGLLREWDPASPASEAIEGADTWLLVRDSAALPLGRVPEPGERAILRATPVPPPAVHTLRELESAAAATPAPASIPSPAFVFGSNAISSPAETVDEFVARLEGLAHSHPDFRAVVFEDPSERERPELTRRLPSGGVRVLDAGCGAGGGVGLARRRHPGWKVVGIERDANLAAKARRHCDRVLEGDVFDALEDLDAAGERFDALVFADVLEHLEDPVLVLARARKLAAAGALLLVSVPNAGHLSIARDLLLGRHDAVAAGLCDAGHLRWFTRASLAEAINEAGWRLENIEAESGAPAPDAAAFLALAGRWPEADMKSLTTYQWIATARPA